MKMNQLSPESLRKNVWGYFDRRRSSYWAAPSTCSIWPPFRSMHCLARRIVAAARCSMAHGMRQTVHRRLHYTCPWGLRDFLGCFGTLATALGMGFQLESKSWKFRENRSLRLPSELRPSRYAPVYSVLPELDPAGLFLATGVLKQPRSLEYLKDAVKPVVRRPPLSVYRAAQQRPRYAGLKCASSERGGHLERVLDAAQKGDRWWLKYVSTSKISSGFHRLWSGFQVIPG